jgi:hypothetical protein
MRENYDWDRVIIIFNFSQLKSANLGWRVRINNMKSLNIKSAGKLLGGLLLLIILSILIAWYFLSSSAEAQKESNIKQEIEKAKHCDEDLDCVDAGGECPFGCYAYVNKNEVDRIRQLIGSFDSKCVYDCISCPTAVCENKKCMAECEDGKLY